MTVLQRLGRTRLLSPLEVLSVSLLLVALVNVITTLTFMSHHLSQEDHHHNYFLGKGLASDVVLAPVPDTQLIEVQTSDLVVASEQQQQSHLTQKGGPSGASPYAYAFVMGGIHEDRPAYKGFLYDVLISASLLRKYGSKADIWLWTQLSPDSNLEELPEEDLRLLHALNIRVEQLEKSKEESFTHIIHEKFRCLQMTQYRRVMFLDVDTMPLLNLDYLFHLSDPEYSGKQMSKYRFRPNLIMASKGEPCNAGMFILEPEEGAWERVKEVIAAQQEAAKNLPYPHFDWDTGWGHNFKVEGDQWNSIEKYGFRWRFHGSHSDQGLLYYYLKYIKQNVSIVIGDRIENWVPGQSGKPELSNTFPNKGDDLAAPEPVQPMYNCGVPNTPIDTTWWYMCSPIYRDFAHFMGKNKPWQIGVNPNWGPKDCTKTKAPYRIWWQELAELNIKHEIGLNIENWDEVHLPQMKESSLGYIAQFKDHVKEVPDSTILVVERVCVPLALQVNKTEELPLASYLARLQVATQETSPARSSEKAKYAYAFVVGSIHEDRLAYKGYLYSVLIAINSLRKFGSKADFWIWTKRSYNSKLEALPAEDLRLLSAMNIHIEQVEDHKESSFNHTMYEKLRVFEMTQYRRVMFLGAETMPLVNLDYLFHLSDPSLSPKDAPTPILRPNLFLASKRKPIDVALFIVQPEEKALQLLHALCERDHEKRLFSQDLGWGHDFKSTGDHWESIGKSGDTWGFPEAHSEQGLLYYYLKYVKQDVSIVIGDRIQTWIRGNGDKPQLENEIPHGLDKHFPRPKVAQYNCGVLDRNPDMDYTHICLPIYRDFAYFNTADKPWQMGQRTSFGPKDCNKWYAPYRLWFKVLRELNDEYDMALDIENWDSVHLSQMKEVIRASPLKETNVSLTELPLASYLAKLQTGKQKNLPKSSKGSRYAYSFLIGGIHEDRPAYKGFLYNVLIAASLLRKYGSTADIWVWTQLSPDSALQDLPAGDLRLLREMDVHVEQLEKSKHESFAHIVYEKFRPLQMTQYQRVMFLDADAIPLLNLDYLFHLSDPHCAPEPCSPVLRPNMIMSSRGKPCNAGMFIVQPKEGAWERLQEVIAAQRDGAKDLPYPHFDWEIGWGHSFAAQGDQWESIGISGNRWRFHGGHSDQGLLYYYLKYIRQDVSIVIGDRIQNWVAGEDGKPKKLAELAHGLDGDHSPKPSEVQYNCLGDYDCALSDRKVDEGFRYMCLPIYRDFAHFMGTSKPWQVGLHPHWGERDCNKYYGPYRLWFRELTELNEKLSLGLDMEHYDKVHLPQMKDSPLGYLAQFKDHAIEIPASSGKVTLAGKRRVNEKLPNLS